MKDVAIALIVSGVILGGIGIGAYLALKDHPWFALLVLLIVGSIRVKTT
jgi:hypothetical protein